MVYVWVDIVSLSRVGESIFRASGRRVGTERRIFLPFKSSDAVGDDWWLFIDFSIHEVKLGVYFVKSFSNPEHQCS